MNTEKSVTQSDSAVPEPSLSYDEIAARMRQALDTIDSLIPTVSLTLDLRYIRQRVGVSPEVIAKAAVAAETSPSLQSLMDLPDTRDMLAMERALRPVFAFMNLVNENLRLALDYRRAKCGAEAMNVYAAAKRLAAGRHPEVAYHVDTIKAIMPKGKGRRRKPKAEPPPATPEPQ